MYLLNKKSFTYVEASIALLILGLLLSIAVFNYTSIIRRARKSEAIAALGAIRIAEKMYKAEYGSYKAAADITTLPGIKSGELNGLYFSQSCYSVSLNGSDFIATCNPGTPVNTAPKASMVSDYGNITINQDGISTNAN